MEHMKPINVIGYKDSYPLSSHFTYGEFTISQTAIRYGIDNIPNENEVLNMEALCADVLEPIREHFGIVNISSGFRCDKLNKKIGGSKTSQHRYGQAADFHCSAATIIEIFEWVILESDIIWDQIIHEGNWIHISYKNDNRKKITTATFKNGKAKYRNFTKKEILNGIEL